MQPGRELGQVQLEPPKTRGDEWLFSLALKAMFIVAVIAILTGVVLFAFSKPTGNHVIVDGIVEPMVQLSRAVPVSSTEWRVSVAGVSEVRNLNNFKAILIKDGSVADELDPLMGTATYIDFFDLDGGGRLTAGDYFRVTCDPGSSYSLHIIWKESGNEIGSTYWDT